MKRTILIILLVVSSLSVNKSTDKLEENTKNYFYNEEKIATIVFDKNQNIIRIEGKLPEEDYTYSDKDGLALFSFAGFKDKNLNGVISCSYCVISVDTEEIMALKEYKYIKGQLSEITQWYYSEQYARYKGKTVDICKSGVFMKRKVYDGEDKYIYETESEEEPEIFKSIEHLKYIIIDGEKIKIDELGKKADPAGYLIQNESIITIRDKNGKERYFDLYLNNEKNKVIIKEANVSYFNKNTKYFNIIESKVLKYKQKLMIVFKMCFYDDKLWFQIWFDYDYERREEAELPLLVGYVDLQKKDIIIFDNEKCFPNNWKKTFKGLGCVYMVKYRNKYVFYFTSREDPEDKAVLMLNEKENKFVELKINVDK